MTDGASQGLFVIVAVVIFGIFVLISYILFRDNLKPSLAKIYCDSFTQVSENTGLGNGLCSVDDSDVEILDDSFDGNKAEIVEEKDSFIRLNYNFNVTIEYLKNYKEVYFTAPDGYKFDRAINQNIDIGFLHLKGNENIKIQANKGDKFGKIIFENFNDFSTLEDVEAFNLNILTTVTK
ncbi:hypothetical protein M1W04_13120 [Enterococcus faecium]|uniref:hypothetical protein n=1 Tax=Enterococcus faecium TaxID=1352 RepID=UPI002543BEC1|nr:hypothetical protein [Enterococcus faecium]MDK4345566.1 hypothetical protein [Enterococcus faecium]